MSKGSWIAGINAVASALEHDIERVHEVLLEAGGKNPRLADIEDKARRNDISVRRVPLQSLDGIAGGLRHQGAIARYEAPKPVERVVARLDRVEGECRPDRAGDLTTGQGVETVGAGSAAVVVYPDGTRLELAARTAVADFADARGKTLVLQQGALSADVVKQPQGQPMTIRTAHAEVRVLGTTLKVTVDPGFTRLDGRSALAELRYRF